MDTKTKPEGNLDQPDAPPDPQAPYDREFESIVDNSLGRGESARTEERARESLRDKEAETASSGTQGKTDTPNPRQLAGAEGSPATGPGMYRPDSGKSKRKISIRKRVGFAAGVAGLGAGGALFLSVFFLPGAKLIHLAQTLKLDFSSNEEATDLSLSRLFRYARTGDLGVTRVSYLGEKVFNNARAQLAEIGVTFEANQAFGNLRTVTFDTTKHPQLRGRTPEQGRTYLAEQFRDKGVTRADIRIVDGTKLVVDSRRIGIAATRAVIKSSLTNLDGGKLATAIRFRNITKFFNLPSLLHPWKKGQAKVEQRLATRAEARIREKERKARISEYVSPEGEIAKRNLREKLRGPMAVVGGVLTFTGVACVIRDASNDAVKFNREIVAIPAAVGAAEAMAMGSQAQYGKDFDLSHVEDAELMISDDNGRDVFDSKPLKAKSDPFVQDGVDLPVEYKQTFGNTTAASLRDAGGFAMAAACSEIGQGIQLTVGLGLLVASIPTGSGSAIAYSALKSVVQMAAFAGTMVGLHHFIVWALDQDPLPDDMAAEIKGGVLAFGSRELAAINERSRAGIELTGTETRAIDLKIAEESRKEFQSKPFLARVFDYTDHRSLASTIIDRQSINPFQQLQNMATGIFGFGFLASGVSDALRLPSAFATDATAYNWESNRFGLPARIINNPDYEDPYLNADYVASRILTGSLHDEYVDRADRCFGVSVLRINDMWSVRPEHDVNPNSLEYEEGHCKEISENWERFMLFIHDSSNMEAAACYEGDDEACLIITGKRF